MLCTQCLSVALSIIIIAGHCGVQIGLQPTNVAGSPHFELLIGFWLASSCPTINSNQTHIIRTSVNRVTPILGMLHNKLDCYNNNNITVAPTNCSNFVESDSKAPYVRSSGKFTGSDTLNSHPFQRQATSSFLYIHFLWLDGREREERERERRKIG